MERYVPELQALCAREVARQLREMTLKEKYEKLQTIPKHLHPYIKAFPIYYFVWSNDECLHHTSIIRHYLYNKKDREYIKKCYQEDCEKGITRRKVILRKCANYYCDNLTLGKIILDRSYDLRFLCCSDCKKSFLHFGDWLDFKRKIEKYQFI